MQQVNLIDSTLNKAYSNPATRRMHFDACRYECLLLRCCNNDKKYIKQVGRRPVEKYSKHAWDFQKLMDVCDYADVDPQHVGTRDEKRTRKQYENLSKEDADTHISDMQFSASELKKFITPLLTEDCNLSKMTQFNDQTKRLGTWVQNYIMLTSKHGIKETDELRALRTGDWRNLQVATSTQVLGDGSYIVLDGKKMYLHVICTKTKEALPQPIPLHERCKSLKKFLRKTWIPMMKKYQDTATPYILCTIAKDPQKRKQLSADSVEKLNMRTFEAAGIEATQNFSRHCDAKRTRKFPNRPEESGHSAIQDVAYANCTADAESLKKWRLAKPYY